jgi:hypothetical protein
MLLEKKTTKKNRKSNMQPTRCLEKGIRINNQQNKISFFKIKKSNETRVQRVKSTHSKGWKEEKGRERKREKREVLR